MRKNKMGDRILIVDDDAAVRETMREFLTMSNFQASAVFNAEEALEFLKKNNIDVVITDILMTGMDGLELTDRIKKDYDIDVIVMTGFSADYSYEKAISKGASDIVFKPVRFEELELRLKRVLKERQLTHERNHMLEKLKKLAITDGLTKLYNSRHFYNQLALEIDRFRRYHHPLSLLLLDIDNFKDYNDAYGHLEGDKVLIKLGKIIQSCLRKLDTACRYGGEEFTIILPETTAAEAMVVAERMRKGVQNTKMRPAPGEEVTITISLGVTEYASEEDIAPFVQRADRAMYLSKQKGRNRTSCLFAENALSQT